MVLFPLDPVLTMLALTLVPILFALISQFNHRIIDVATEVRSTESPVYSLVQAFTKEEEEHRRFMGGARRACGRHCGFTAGRRFTPGRSTS
jgi:hypothetical protein